MATTIQISDTTKKKLDFIKKSSKKTYDEIVNSLLKKQEMLLLRDESAEYYAKYADDDLEEVNEFKDDVI